MSTNDEDTKTWTAAQHNDWLYAVFRDPKLPHRACVLGAATAFQLGRKGYFRASLPELADAAGIGERITRRAIAELRDTGYWRVTMRPGRMSYQIDLLPQVPGASLEPLEWHETLAENRRYATKDRAAADGYEEKAAILRELWRDPHTSLHAKRVGAAAIYRLAGHRSAFHAQTDELYAVSGTTRKVARPAIAELAARHYWNVEPIADSIASEKYTLLSPPERRSIWRKAEQNYQAAVQRWLLAEECHIRKWSEGLQSFWAELLQRERQPYIDWFAAEQAYIAQCNEWLTAEFDYQHKFQTAVFDLLTFAGVNEAEAWKAAKQKCTEHQNGLFPIELVGELVSVMEGIKRARLEEAQPWGGPGGHHSVQRLEPTAAEVSAANDAWTADAAAVQWEAGNRETTGEQSAAERDGDTMAEMGQGAAEIGQGAAEIGQGAAEIGQGAAQIGHENLTDQRKRFLSHEGHKVLNDEDAAPYRTRLDGAPSGLAWTDEPQPQPAKVRHPRRAVDGCSLCNARGLFLDGSQDDDGTELLYEMSTEDGLYSRNIECQHSLEANLAEIRRIELGGKWEATKSCWHLIDDYFGHIFEEDVYDPVTGRIILADEDEYAYN
ncbi:hypothetical protein [Mycobacterium sp. 1245852.3]|uniref:hypothetical protein n=1 Tax=Mycobacterium sp. 1245852.3 TaxID=1856860 RepID=UPI0007FF94FA|nr:hypothetical protein [Mycobacterium sp. 1245852.3]OBJ86972.1 hypothetical protein A9W96_02355 [Mycobacterium sp. 1245852.3]